MSLFNELQGTIIENPKWTWSYKKIRERKKQKEEVKTEKELRMEMKEKLSPKEYQQWWSKRYYEKKKDYLAEQYQKKKKEKEIELEELREEILNERPSPVDYDEYYMEKYKDDDTDWQWYYRFYWWYGRLKAMIPWRCKKIKQPIRIYDKRGLNTLIANVWKYQEEAYQYLKPYINEISEKDFWIWWQQKFTKSPNRWYSWKMRELVDNTDIPRTHLCNVASAMLRDKYIRTEIYLWRVCFLLWDIIISTSWNVFRPMLWQSIPWLTKDTVEEWHNKRQQWLKKKIDELPVYVLRDAYLMKIQPNERETYFYIVPT